MIIRVIRDMRVVRVILVTNDESAERVHTQRVNAFFTVTSTLRSHHTTFDLLGSF